MERKNQQQEREKATVQPGQGQEQAGEKAEVPQTQKPGASEHFRELGEEAPAGNYESPTLPPG